MKCIQCPKVYTEKEKSIFLAGGITGCADWQSKFIELLKEENIVILNPRREKYAENFPDIEKEQITWEFNHLKLADAVIFWFPKDTLCPITLYELGKVSVFNKPIFIGVDPEYLRKSDVEIQTNLIRPEVQIVYSLEELSSQVKKWINSKN
ncbi:MAG: nucleoside 2-deoxyribosyltransferase domain-containing protein [archaeon]